MQIIEYYSASEFLEANLEYLELNEAINSLMIGLCISNLTLKKDTALYLSIQQNKQIICAVIKISGRNLILYSDGQYTDKFAPELMDYLAANQITIPGLIGPKELAIRCAEFWARKNKGSYKISFSQLAYRLDELIYEPKIPGQIRLADQNDLPLISNWFNLFSQEALNENNKKEAIETARQKLSNQEVYLWKNHTDVAMACIARPTNNGISINYVYTPKEQRSKGYGTKLVAQLSKHMLAKGFQFCTLFSDLGNPTSNSIYNKIGYQPVEEFRSIDLLE